MRQRVLLLNRKSSYLKNNHTNQLFRLPRTAVRVPRHKERVYSMSVNGSPISAANDDIVISIPSRNGEVSAQGPARRCPELKKKKKVKSTKSLCCLVTHFNAITCLQSLQLLASQMDSVDVSLLDQTALKSIRLLQVRRWALLKKKQRLFSSV